MVDWSTQLARQVNQSIYSETFSFFEKAFDSGAKILPNTGDGYRQKLSGIEQVSLSQMESRNVEIMIQNDGTSKDKTLSHKKISLSQNFEHKERLEIIRSDITECMIKILDSFVKELSKMRDAQLEDLSFILKSVKSSYIQRQSGPSLKFKTAQAAKSFMTVTESAFAAFKGHWLPNTTDNIKVDKDASLEHYSNSGQMTESHNLDHSDQNMETTNKIPSNMDKEVIDRSAPDATPPPKTQIYQVQNTPEKIIPRKNRNLKLIPHKLGSNVKLHSLKNKEIAKHSMHNNILLIKYSQSQDRTQQKQNLALTNLIVAPLVTIIMQYESHLCTNLDIIKKVSNELKDISNHCLNIFADLESFVQRQTSNVEDKRETSTTEDPYLIEQNYLFWAAMTRKHMSTCVKVVCEVVQELMYIEVAKKITVFRVMNNFFQLQERYYKQTQTVLKNTIKQFYDLDSVKQAKFFDEQTLMTFPKANSQGIIENKEHTDTDEQTEIEESKSSSTPCNEETPTVPPACDIQYLPPRLEISRTPEEDSTNLSVFASSTSSMSTETEKEDTPSRMQKNKSRRQRLSAAARAYRKSIQSPRFKVAVKKITKKVWNSPRSKHTIRKRSSESINSNSTSENNYIDHQHINQQQLEGDLNNSASYVVSEPTKSTKKKKSLPDDEYNAGGLDRFQYDHADEKHASDEFLAVLSELKSLTQQEDGKMCCIYTKIAQWASGFTTCKTLNEYRAHIRQAPALQRASPLIQHLAGCLRITDIWTVSQHIIFAPRETCSLIYLFQQSNELSSEDEITEENLNCVSWLPVTLSISHKSILYIANRGTPGFLEEPSLPVISMHLDQLESVEPQTIRFSHAPFEEYHLKLTRKANSKSPYGNISTFFMRKSDEESIKNKFRFRFANQHDFTVWQSLLQPNHNMDNSQIIVQHKAGDHNIKKKSIHQALLKSIIKFKVASI